MREADVSTCHPLDHRAQAVEVRLHFFCPYIAITDLDNKESLSSYKKGGYHPVRIGDKLDHSRYVIRTKLGWGQFSTVWVAQESRQVI